MRACLTASIHNHTARLAKGAKLAGIDKFEMLQYWHKYQWLTRTPIDERHVYVADGSALPERLDIMNICMKCIIVNVGYRLCAHLRYPFKAVCTCDLPQPACAW